MVATKRARLLEVAKRRAWSTTRKEAAERSGRNHHVWANSPLALASESPLCHWHPNTLDGSASRMSSPVLDLIGVWKIAKPVEQARYLWMDLPDRSCTRWKVTNHRLTRRSNPRIVEEWIPTGMDFCLTALNVHWEARRPTKPLGR